MTFDNVLTKVGLNEEEYLKAVQTSVQSDKIFLNVGRLRIELIRT